MLCNVHTLALEFGLIRETPSGPEIQRLPSLKLLPELADDCLLARSAFHTPLNPAYSLTEYLAGGASKCIIAIELEMDNTARLTMVTPHQSLLHILDAYRRQGVNPGKPVPWDEWGPPNCQFLLGTWTAWGSRMVGSSDVFWDRIHGPIHVADFNDVHFEKIIKLLRVQDKPTLQRLRSKNIEVFEVPDQIPFQIVFAKPVKMFLQYLKIEVAVAGHNEPLNASALIDEERVVFMHKPQVSPLFLY